MRTFLYFALAILIIAAGGLLAHKHSQAPHALGFPADSPIAAGRPPTPTHDMPYTVLSVPDTVIAGRPVRYAYTLTNDTPRVVEEITIFIPLNGWQLVGYTISGPAVAKDKGEFFAGGSIAAGDSIVITITAIPTKPVGNPVVCLHAATTYGNPVGVGSSVACTTVMPADTDPAGDK